MQPPTIQELETRHRHLEARVTELEERLAEAGRRAIFHESESVDPTTEPVTATHLANVGRALLFDTETR